MTVLADRYELIERIAGGGMGQVWRGRDQVLQRIVAIKVVALDGQDSTAKERFRREAVATAGLSAPQIVQVYDAGFSGGDAFLVMELLTGPSLAELISERGHLSLAEGLHVAREVTRGLLAAHRIGVVHRDIKPGNVMFNDDQVKLVDFGIAQLSEAAGASLTAPATALGTAAYMSPERASGQPAGPAADWYALGCLMMTMFTGKPPFAGEALAVINQQVNSEPPRLSSRMPDAPAALDELVAQLLAKDPEQRPDGEQVLEQLRMLEVDPTAATILLTPTTATRVLGNQDRATFAETPSDREPVRPVPAPRPAPRPAPQGPRKKPIWPWIVGLVVLMALGLWALVSLAQSRPAPAPRPEPTVTSTPSPTRTTKAPTTNPPTTKAPTQAPTTRQPTKEPTRQPTTQETEPESQKTPEQTPEQ